MIRFWSLTILAVLFATFVCSQGRCADVEKTDAQKILDELKDLKESLRQQKSSNDAAIAELTRRMETLESAKRSFERICSDEFTRINRRLDELGQPGGRISQQFNPAPQSGTGRINLVNEWDFDVTFDVNGRTFNVASRQRFPIGEMPFGTYTVQVSSVAGQMVPQTRTVILNPDVPMRDVTVYRQ